MFTIKRISKVGSTELVINMYIRSLTYLYIGK